MRLLANPDEFESHAFPATTGEIIEEYGGLELDLADGSETLGDALSRLGEETFERSEDVRFATYSAVSGEAVGRRHYSDRDSPAMGEAGPDEVSF
jgi:hypothetical protein